MENLLNEIIDDRYKIIDFLGEGGTAKVYKAHDLVTDKDVSIKMMKEEVAAVKASLSRFEREARAAASLNHVNIVKVINVGTYKGLPYIVNEFINGSTLKDIMDIRGKFSFLEALDIMNQLCLAVCYAHKQGVIHRDIKPQNIFLTKDGTIKLGDFGIATFQNASPITKPQVVIGSVHYIAPEIPLGKPVTERSDIYSMGITFFELITDSVPFDNPNPYTVTIMHIKNKFPSIKKFNPRVPASIEEIIYKACAKKPSDRYKDADEMQKAIMKIIADPSLLEKTSSNFFSFLRLRKNSDNLEKKEVKKRQKEIKKEMKKARKK